MVITDRQFVEGNYDHDWWTHKEQLIEFVKLYGGTIEEGNPGSFLGLDHLNGGVDDLEPIVELLKTKNQTHLLDVGSGLGGPARYLAKSLNVKITGIDISTKQVESANSLSKILSMDKTKFIHLEGDNLPFEEKIFSSAYCIETLVHVENKSDYLRNINRVLIDDGLFVVADYFSQNNDNEIKDLFPQGYFPWRDDNFVNIFKDNGFEPISILDRSDELADSYENFSKIFGDDHVTNELYEWAKKWWINGTSNELEIRKRLLGLEKFISQREDAVTVLLGKNLNRIINFCKLQARLCRLKKVKFKIIFLKKINQLS